MTGLDTQNELGLFIQRTEQYLDEVVSHGDDQALFIASYLQGHFAVEAGKSQVLQMTQTAQLAALMQESLEKAFSNNELEASDRQQVIDLWHKLLSV